MFHNQVIAFTLSQLNVSINYNELQLNSYLAVIRKYANLFLNNFNSFITMKRREILVELMKAIHFVKIILNWHCEFS